MRLIPVGLGVVTGLQVVAAAAAYPILTLGVGLAVSVYGMLVSPDPSARTVLFFAGLPSAFGALMMAAVFAAIPLGVCVAGSIVVGRLGCRRSAKAPVLLLLKFGTTLVVINVLALFVGTLFWPLALCFALNASLDAALVAIVLRSQIKAG